MYSYIEKFSSFIRWDLKFLRQKLHLYENNQQDALYRLIYYFKSALHVSGDVFSHHQEHLTEFTVSGSVHPSCCRLPATWVNTTRYCKYNFFIITNLIHKFLVHSHKLRKIKFLYVFRAQSAHHQEVTMQIVHMQSLVLSLSASGRLVQPLRKSSLSGCTRRSLAESDNTRGCICTVCVDLLMMNGLRSKHVEEFNFM